MFGTAPNLRDIRAMHAKREKAIADAHAIHAAATAERRDMTAGEQSRFDLLLAEAQTLAGDIGTAEAAREAERNAPVPARVPVASAAAAGRRLYADLFPETVQASSEFNGFGDFMRSVHGRIADPRLVASAGSNSSVGSDGGFLVPVEYAGQLLDASLENEIVRPRAVVRPLAAATVNVAGFDTQNHSASIGGFVGQWLDEGAQMTLQKGLIRNLKLQAKKLGILTAATNELVADSPYFETELRQMLASAIGWHLDLAYLTGTGAGQPLGVMNDPALITVAKESGQAADTIVWTNIKKMYARLHPASIDRAVWVANTTTKVQLLSLVQPITNVAGSENVGGSWIPVLRDDGRGGFTMLGIPVVFTEKTPVVGDKGDLMLCDFSQYVIGLRKEMTLDRSGHVGFDTDETYYRAIVRSDGMGRWSKAVTPRNGDTLSWCVALAERS